MAQGKQKARKDNKGRALRKGEMQSKEDLMYAYSYTDPMGRRKRIYASTLVELRKKEDALVKDQLDGLDVYVAGDADLNFIFDRYMSTKTELRKTTYSNYVYMYNRFVRDTFGKKKLRDIKYSDVLQFYFVLMNEKNIQVNTLETIHTAIHPALQMAVRDNIIRINPSDGVIGEIKKKWAGKKAGIRHALTVDQQRAFINYCRESHNHWRWAPLFTVMLGTGCRVGEIVGLRWDDLDFENRIININHSVVYYTREDDSLRSAQYKVSMPKTEAGIRTIPMMQPVYDAFMLEKEYQEQFGECDQEIDGLSGFVFCNRFGNVHNPQAINRAIKRISEDYNAIEVVEAKKEKREPVILPHFSCHHLRHTFCTRLCEKESNIKFIQDIMGHADIETTLGIYADVTNESKDKVMTKLAAELDVF